MLFGIGLLVMAWLLPEFFIWLFSEFNLLAGFGLLLLPGIGWVLGTQEADSLMKRAETLRTDAMRTKATALSQAEDLRQQAEHDQRAADALMRDARREMRSVEKERGVVSAMRQSVEIKNRGDDLGYIEHARGLPLEKRIEISLRVGRFPRESEERYWRRRRELVISLVQRWENASRFGYPLLPIVEAQHGLCGNPRKDPSRKGCGTYLYSFPVAAVHIDHITPKSKGGSDHPDNFQALCSYCNTKAGNRT